ncbi:MAG: hypothetical protein JXB25_03090 [Deltaproteobacteria bacterium]|nr:hypothetical protein [Deltaproteobacteria bacterium]
MGFKDGAPGPPLSGKKGRRGVRHAAMLEDRGGSGQGETAKESSHSRQY